MRIDIITIFPEVFEPVFSSSIIKIAQKKKLLKIQIHNLRSYTSNKHKKVDAPGYGGGPGMVLQCQPIFKATEQVKKIARTKKSKVVLLSPQGKALTQSIAKKLLKLKQLILICGHYEGVDERVRTHLADEEISIGDYILSGGELAAMVVVDVLARLIPGVVGNCRSIQRESFEKNLLDFPHYTKPQVFRRWRVPEVLISGNHAKIESWRKAEALKNTKRKRPDLIKNLPV